MLVVLLALSGACVFVTKDDEAGRLDGDGDSVLWPDDCDDADASVGLPAPWYTDGDGDGWGAGDPVEACAQPAGRVAADGDCDDGDTRYHPGATEDDCTDPNDYNCDGSVGYADDDGDGTPACLDCDDADDTVYPDAPDTWYDGLDSDCGGDDDFDADGDGYTVEGADSGSGDCDDSDDTIHLEAAETWYDGVDSDCGGDDDFDADGDGYGAEGVGGGSQDDCDDGDAAISPGEVEVCGDDIPEDCDGVAPPCAWLDVTVDDAVAVFEDADGSDHMATSVAIVPDLDGDGIDDVAIGTPDDDTAGSDFGAVYVFSGPVSGSYTPADAVAALYGADANHGRAGYTVSGIGDINGDGYGDLAVAAYNSTGHLYLLLGPISGDISLADAEGRHAGEQTCAGAGLADNIRGGFDADGDELGDLPVGSHGDPRGGAYLLLGPATASGGLEDIYAARFYDDSSSDVGGSVEGADVTGDGVLDVWIGEGTDSRAATSAGAVSLVEGPVSGDVDLASAASVRVLGAAEHTSLGRPISIADLDGDGYLDLAAGGFTDSTASTEAGVVYALAGPITADGSVADLAMGVRFGVAEGEHAGVRLRACGDQDGDGRADLVIGTNRASSDVGRAYVVLGPASGSASLSDAYTIIEGGAAGDRAGSALSCEGDATGDGLRDLLVGAPYDGDPATEAGRAWLFSGTGM
ncbi:MAG: hypothetical protein D6798_11830 [Deltaproteobacteria bacterium]|nr:MAG: hypothetical protein D6798_11830 [Deltaproteobacteria bacterium]